jgi:hypothetical protein
MARAAEYTPPSSTVLALPFGFLGRQIIERVDISGCTRLPTEINKLVRIYFNADDFIIATYDLRFKVRAFIGPFIKGVGQVECRDTPERFVILRADIR